VAHLSCLAFSRPRDTLGALPFAREAARFLRIRGKGWDQNSRPCPKDVGASMLSGQRHFITCSCYRRQQFLGSARRRDLFLKILDEVRQQYDFVVWGYMVMPEHCHLLISEPEKRNVALVMQESKSRRKGGPSANENGRIGLQWHSAHGRNRPSSSQQRPTQRLRLRYHSPHGRRLVTTTLRRICGQGRGGHPFCTGGNVVRHRLRCACEPPEACCGMASGTGRLRLRLCAY